MLTVRRSGVGSPLDALFQIRREVDRIFGEEWTERESVAQWVPPMDVVETDEELKCLLELPGIARENLSITVEDNVLTVTGEKKLERREGEGELLLFERRYGRFQRSMTLPRHVDASKVRAGYEDGVLTITLQKSEQAKARQIPIEGASERREIGP